MMKHILYNNARCPFCLRARLALANSRIDFDLKEIDLANKPQELLDLSPKGTVPVLVILSDKDIIITESLDIIIYAKEYSPNYWIDNNSSKSKILLENFESLKSKIVAYARENDGQIYPPFEDIFLEISDLLSKNLFLFGTKPDIADFAMFPFLRRFVEITHYDLNKIANINRWIQMISDDPLFKKVI